MTASDVRSQLVPTPDGRVLHVYDDGEPGDRRVPLVVHHGTPTSGLPQPSQLADARSRGMRLVSFDRPGLGGSTRRPGRRVADVADDVTTIADALGFDRFVTWGGSGGGPHALACGALLPDRVAAVACVAGVAPRTAAGLDWMAGMGADNVEEFGAADQGEAALREFLTPARAELLSTSPETLADAMRSLLPDRDVQAMDAGVGPWLHAAMMLALADWADGWLDDDLAFVQPWGFEPADVRVPVLVAQGQLDLMVPVAHGRWLAEALPHSESWVLPDEGHLSLMGDPGPQHAWLLDRVADGRA